MNKIGGGEELKVNQVLQREGKKLEQQSKVIKKLSRILKRKDYLWIEVDFFNVLSNSLKQTGDKLRNMSDCDIYSWLKY